MYCRYCGKAIAEDSEFCTYCGRLIGDNTNTENATTEENLCNIKLNAESGCFSEYLPLIVRTLCYIALGAFLFFNIKMAPFFGVWKFIAYVIEAAIVIYLTVLTKNRISESNVLSIKMMSVVFSLFIILSSFTLRIVYEYKVDAAEKDIPYSGTILVDVSQHTDFYSYIKEGVVRNPNTSISINGHSEPAKVNLGQSNQLEITVKGNYISGTTSEVIILYASDFVNGEHSFTKTVHVSGDISATVKVELRRYCTFWEVISH